MTFAFERCEQFGIALGFGDFRHRRRFVRTSDLRRMLGRLRVVLRCLFHCTPFDRQFFERCRFGYARSVDRFVVFDRFLLG